MFYQTGGVEDVVLTHSGVKAALFPLMDRAVAAMDQHDDAVMVAFAAPVPHSHGKRYAVWVGSLLSFQEWRFQEKNYLVPLFNSMLEVIREDMPVKLFMDVDRDLKTQEEMSHAQQAKVDLLKESISFFKGMRKSFLDTRSGPVQVYEGHRMKTDRHGAEYLHLSYHFICPDLVFDNVFTQKRAWECYLTRLGGKPDYMDRGVYRRNGLVRMPGSWKVLEDDMAVLVGGARNDTTNPTMDYVLSCGHSSALIDEERLHAKFHDVLKVVDRKTGRARASPKAAQGFLNDVACRMLAESMEFPPSTKFTIRVEAASHQAIVTASGTPRCVVTGNQHKFDKSALMINLLDLSVTRTCRSTRCISPQPYYVQDPENLFLAIIQSCYANAGWCIEDDQPLLDSIVGLTSEEQPWRRVDVGAIIADGGDKISRGDVTFIFNDKFILMSMQGQLLLFDLPSLEVIAEEEEEEEVGEKRKHHDGGVDATLVLALMHRKELVPGLAYRNSAITFPAKVNPASLNTFFRRHLDYLMSTQGLCIDQQNRLYALDGHIYKEIVGTGSADCKLPLARYLRHQAILHGGPELYALAHEWTPMIQTSFEANIQDLSGTMSTIERAHCHAYNNGVLFFPCSITEENQDINDWFLEWDELRVRNIHGVLPMATHDCDFDPAWSTSTEYFPDLMGIFRMQNFSDHFTGKSLGMLIGKSVMSKPLAAGFNRDKTDMVWNAVGASESGKTRLLNLTKSYFPVETVKEAGNGRGSTLGALSEFVDSKCNLIVFGDMDASNPKFFREEFNLQVFRAIVDGTSVPVSNLNSRTNHEFINSAMLMAANPGMLGHENLAIMQSLQTLMSMVRRKFFNQFYISAGGNRDDKLEQKLMQPIARAAALSFSLQQYVNIYLEVDGPLHALPEVKLAQKSILCEYSHIYAYLNASAHIGNVNPSTWSPIKPCPGESVSIRDLRQAAAKYAASNGRRVRVETCTPGDIKTAFDSLLSTLPEFLEAFVAMSTTGARYYYCPQCYSAGGQRFMKDKHPACIGHQINSGPYVATGSIMNVTIEGLDREDQGSDDGMAPGFTA